MVGSGHLHAGHQPSVCRRSVPAGCHDGRLQRLVAQCGGNVGVECGQVAPYQVTRRWLVFNVPTLFYPLAMWELFSLLSGGFHLSDTISLALGYGLGKGKLDFLKVSSRHVKALEESNMFLNSRLRQIGWVGGPAARGAAAWSQLEPEPLGGRQVGFAWMLLLFVVCCLLSVVCCLSSCLSRLVL